jgi:hypothetical protein
VSLPFETKPSFVQSVQQIELLLEDLAAIFRVVSPSMRNLEAFGAGIRDLIILACTEVEAQWKGILTANHVQPAGIFFKTTDYVKLYSPLKLNEYELYLVRYPDIKPTAPLRSWDATNPTTSLPWYEAYNQVKHDREKHFKDASLGHAIEAVAACIVMLAAQFGPAALRRHKLMSLFEFKLIPKWEPKELYYEPIPNEKWRDVDYPF